MMKQDGSARRPAPAARKATRLSAVVIAAVALCAMQATQASAQMSDRVLRAAAGEYRPGSPLPLTIEFTSASGIRAVRASYRLFGGATWTVREMQLVGSSASYAIPADELRPAVLEYYFTFSTGSGPDSTYPVFNPETQPLTVDLGAAAPGAASLMILSPEPGEHMNRDDVLISFSVPASDSSVDPARTKVFLDGEDLSEHLVSGDGFFVLRPENAGVEPDGGSHSVRVVIYDTTGAPAGERAWDFYVRGPRLGPADGEIRPWEGHGTVRLETRNETLSGLVTPYNRATVDARATDGRFEFTGHLHLTNEEKDYRQPQNRFFIGAESPWVKLGYGDTYPVMPDMIISGKRVRGFSGAVTAGFFDFDVVAGDIVRNVEGDTLHTFPIDSLNSELAADSIGPYGPYDTGADPDLWAKYDYGTFDRSMLIIRPSFRFGPSVLGFTALHSKDDLGSITYGGAPEENSLAGTDLTLSFDRKNIEIRGQAAFSLYNSNIRGGTISDEELDSLFSDGSYESFDRDDIETARDVFSRFITVNENLVPLGVTDMPTASWEAGLALNYQPNNFSFTWMRHGASYYSFGQPFFRRDIEGWAANDRVRLAGDRLQLSAGMERLQDNTAGTKPATTTFTTISGGVSWFSKNEVPNITVGLLSMANNNPIDPALPLSVDDNTLRLVVQLSRQFTLGARHFTSAGFSVSRRDDDTYRDLDSRNTSFSFSVVTDYDAPLRTTASAMYYMNEVGPSSSPVAEIGYTILFFGAEYRLMRDRLFLNAAVSPTLGDIDRTLLDAGARYAFTPELSLEGKFDLYLIDGADSDVIWSLVLRAGI
jgi:hypothetical protein